jgi:uncharacterized membrane protein YhaH (DUF805 family)
MIAASKLTSLQLGIVFAVILNETIRTVSFDDYTENPVAVLTPVFLAILLCVWVVTCVRLVHDARNSLPIPKWCKVVQWVVGVGFLGLFVAMGMAFLTLVGL